MMNCSSIFRSLLFRFCSVKFRTSASTLARRKEIATDYTETQKKIRQEILQMFQSLWQRDFVPLCLGGKKQNKNLMKPFYFLIINFAALQ